MPILPHIIVCICTYKRASLLPPLLAAICKQATEGNFTFSIRIVDNDANCSAREPVEAIASRSPIAIEYLAEPRQNISLARNKAVAGLKADYVALIDDDETPPVDWLKNLFLLLSPRSVDGVLGPVVPEFPENAPKWLSRSGVCDRPQHPTGHELHYSQARTGNALLRAELFTGETEPFNPNYGLSGGEDSDFFMRKTAAGRRFVWCQEAPVFERVPESRWSLSYYFRRQFRGGALDGEREKHPGRILRSSAAVLIHAIRVLFLLPLGKQAYAKPLVSLANHLGYVSAAFGFGFRRHREETIAPPLASHRVLTNHPSSPTSITAPR